MGTDIHGDTLVIRSQMAYSFVLLLVSGESIAPVALSSSLRNECSECATLEQSTDC